MNQMTACIAQAAAGDFVVPGFNVFGYEDAQAIIRAAERAASPVLLMVNRDARRVMRIEHWGALLGALAKSAAVPVGVHLDHCDDPAQVCRAIESGYTSVMYDGSHAGLKTNLRNTRELAVLAHARGVAIEAEIGTVPYDDLGETAAQLTLPEEAAQLAAESRLDWLAVSVGNVHRLTDRQVHVRFDILRKIEQVCAAPLVIHGASGLYAEDVQKLRQTRVGKMNIGTALRRVFGDTLRQQMAQQPQEFDRLALFAEPVRAVEEKAYEMIAALCANGG